MQVSVLSVNETLSCQITLIYNSVVESDMFIYIEQECRLWQRLFYFILLFALFQVCMSSKLKRTTRSTSSGQRCGRFARRRLSSGRCSHGGRGWSIASHVTWSPAARRPVVGRPSRKTPRRSSSTSSSRRRTWVDKALLLTESHLERFIRIKKMFW